MRLSRFLFPWLLLVGISTSCAAVTNASSTPRTAILCAFEPEWTARVGLVKHPQTRTVQGVRVVSGTLQGQPLPGYGMMLMAAFIRAL